MDFAMDAINKKTWDKTKPIMICNVMNFFTWIGIGVTVFLGSDFFWFMTFFISSLLFTCLAVHFAWQLELRL